MKMKNFIVLSILLFSFMGVHSQSVLKGKIVNSRQEAVPYANVVILSPRDSTLIGGTVTNDKGEFDINLKNEGKYILKISCIGYDTKIQNISTGDLKETVFELTGTVSTLGGVVVSAKRPLIKQEVDRYVVDVTNLKIGKFDIMDMLPEIPGIIVQDGTPSIIGKSGMKVMLNDRLLNLSGDALTAFLKTLDINNVVKVEVIKNPPARFEAEGDYGILNIITKRRTDEYYGGRIAEDLSYDKHWVSNPSLNLNYNDRKFTLYLTGDYDKGKNHNDEFNKQYYNSFLRSETYHQLSPFHSYETSDGFEYDASKNDALGGNISYSNESRVKKDDGISEMSFYNANVADSIVNSNLRRDMPTKKLDATAFWDHNFKGKNNEMWISANYYHYKNEQNSDFRSNLSYDNTTKDDYYDFTNYGNNNLRGFSGLADFQLEVMKWTLSFGGKVSFSKTNSGSTYIYPNLSEQDDLFKYYENIYATYAQVTRKIDSKTTIKAGFRYEETSTRAKSEGESGTTNHNYGHIFPNILIDHDFDAKNNLRFGYVGSITRPGIRYMNPFKIYGDKYDYTEGNPFLKPSYEYDASLDYTYDNNLTTEIYSSSSKDAIGQVINMDESSKTTETKWENTRNNDEWGVDIYYSWRHFSWMSSTIFLIGSYTKSKALTAYTLPTAESLGGYLNFILEFYLNKQKTLSEQLSMVYRTKQKNCDVKTNAQYNMYYHLQWTTLKDHLSLNFSVSNILQPKYSGTAYSNGTTMQFRNKYNPLTFEFKVAYSIGKTKSSNSSKYEDSEIKGRF